MKKYIILVFIGVSSVFALQTTAQGINPADATNTLIEEATKVTATSGGYTFAVVLLTVTNVLTLGFCIYLIVTKRNDDKENEEYLRSIAKEAITAVIKTETGLDTTTKVLAKLGSDHDKILDGISQVKGGMK